MLGEPECFTRKCAHFTGVKWLGEDETSEVVYCEAFPDGIPSEISYGNNKHLTKHPDQKNEILYKKLK